MSLRLSTRTYRLFLFKHFTTPLLLQEVKKLAPLQRHLLLAVAVPWKLSLKKDKKKEDKKTEKKRETNVRHEQ